MADTRNHLQSSDRHSVICKTESHKPQRTLLAKKTQSNADYVHPSSFARNDSWRNLEYLLFGFPWILPDLGAQNSPRLIPHPLNNQWTCWLFFVGMLQCRGGVGGWWGGEDGWRVEVGIPNGETWKMQWRKLEYECRKWILEIRTVTLGHTNDGDWNFKVRK